jgi:hypothetical protein
MADLKEGGSIGEITVSVEKPKQIVPWGLHPMEDYVFNQLKSRAQEYDFNIDPNEGAYAGPRTAWVRMFSNGVSSREDETVRKSGFAMGGAETFNESYGFNPDKKITIGVDSRGNPHEIDAVVGDGSSLADDFPHRPPPSVVSVTSEFSGAAGNAFTALCRKTTINWRCYSLNQLNYLIPYFLTPRISLIVEWGWNNYNISSLIDLTDLEGMTKIWSGEYDATIGRIKTSNGNYDYHMGFIVDYGYRLAEDGGYECNTTIMNPNFMIGGQAYQTSTIEQRKPDGTKSKMKDFIEFKTFDLNGLTAGFSRKTYQTADDAKVATAAARGGMAVITPIATGTDFVGALITDKNKQIFTNSSGTTWLRMDLVANIINAFFERNFKDDKGNLINDAKLTKFVVKNVPLCAHPALKSTNPNILVPNATAPRFAKSAEANKGDSIPSVSNYDALFPRVKTIVDENKYTNEYDNIQEAIGAEKSFPIYDIDYSSKNGKKAPKGYYGYLEDLYISTSILSSEIGNNDTVQKLLEAILQHINRGLCDLVQLKLETVSYNNGEYSLHDSNFSSVSTPQDAADLKRINVNSTDSAFMRSARFDIKISQDMMNNMIMLSAKNAPLDKPITQVANDPKFMKYDPTSEGDRFFSRADQKVVIASSTSDASEKTNNARLFTSDSKDHGPFVVETKETIRSFSGIGRKGTQKVTKTYVIAEKDPDFLKNILIDVDDKRAIYLNNGLMPGTEFHAEFLGIGGITYLSQFTLDHVPSTYNYKNAVWQIADVKHKIENKMWTTSIMAQARPLTILNDTKSNP